METFEPSSCDVSDACDELALPAVRTGALRPLWPESPPLAGAVTTVRLELAPGAGSPLRELLDVLSRASGTVLFVDLCGRTDLQCWGSVLATAASRFGYRGALVNGAARDVEGLRELGFPSFARGVYPGAIRGRLALTAVDRPVLLDGAEILPGDFAVADASGAVFVPRERADDVLALAAARRREEEQQRRAVAAGADPRTAFAA